MFESVDVDPESGVYTTFATEFSRIFSPLSFVYIVFSSIFFVFRRIIPIVETREGRVFPCIPKFHCFREILSCLGKRGRGSQTDENSWFSLGRIN